MDLRNGSLEVCVAPPKITVRSEKRRNLRVFPSSERLVTPNGWLVIVRRRVGSGTGEAGWPTGGGDRGTDGVLVALVAAYAERVVRIGNG